MAQINECAIVMAGTRRLIHFAMQKLAGLNKTWYENLNTILFTWAEWQVKIMDAFRLTRWQKPCVSPVLAQVENL